MSSLGDEAQRLNMNDLVVLKFGGSSMGKKDNHMSHMENMMRIITDYQKKYKNVIVVCSAFQGETDRLIQEADRYLLDGRRRDRVLAQGEIQASGYLADFLNANNIGALAMNNGNLPIGVSGSYGVAVISNVNVRCVREQLNRRRVVVIPGFIGRHANGNLMTIGRDGSDTTAFEVARFMRADRLCLFKDVEGIYPANPKTVPSARPYWDIASRDLHNMALCGAGIVNKNAAKIALDCDFEVHVLPTFGDGSGTLISNRYPSRAVAGIVSPGPKDERYAGRDFVPVSIVGQDVVERFQDKWRQAFHAAHVRFEPLDSGNPDIMQATVHRRDVDKVLVFSHAALVEREDAQAPAFRGKHQITGSQQPCYAGVQFARA